MPAATAGDTPGSQGWEVLAVSLTGVHFSVQVPWCFLVSIFGTANATHFSCSIHTCNQAGLFCLHVWIEGPTLSLALLSLQALVLSCVYFTFVFSNLTQQLLPVAALFAQQVRWEIIIMEKHLKDLLISLLVFF